MIERLWSKGATLGIDVGDRAAWFVPAEAYGVEVALDVRPSNAGSSAASSMRSENFDGSMSPSARAVRPARRGQPLRRTGRDVLTYRARRRPALDDEDATA
jgi:hypothetical protein